jgi:hypothetical protein
MKTCTRPARLHSLHPLGATWRYRSYEAITIMMPPATTTHIRRLLCFPLIRSPSSLPLLCVALTIFRVAPRIGCM